MDIFNVKRTGSRTKKIASVGLNNKSEYNRSLYFRKQEQPSPDKIKKNPCNKGYRNRQSRRDRECEVLRKPKQTHHRMRTRTKEKESERKHRSEKKYNNTNRISQSRKRSKSERNNDQNRIQRPNLYESRNNPFANAFYLRDFSKRHNSQSLKIREEPKPKNIYRL